MIVKVLIALLRHTRVSIVDPRRYQESPLSSEHTHQQHLVRSLGLVDIIMIGIAGLVGGAIFVLTGPAIGLAGPAADYRIHY